jgi:hypothetical protein
MQHGFVYMHNNTYNEVNLMLKMRSNYDFYFFFFVQVHYCVNLIATVRPHELQDIGAK